MFCETTILVGLIIPGDTIVLVASTGVTDPVQYVGMLAAVIIGSLAGESVGFTLGRWFGHRIRRSKLGQRLGEGNWVRAERYLERRGGIAVFASRFLPGAARAGAAHRRDDPVAVPALHGLDGSGVHRLGGGLCHGGNAGGQRLSRPHRRSCTGPGYLFGAVVLVFFVAVLLIRRAIERREARHWDAEHPEGADEAE